MKKLSIHDKLAKINEITGVNFQIYSTRENQIEWKGKYFDIDYVLKFLEQYPNCRLDTADASDLPYILKSMGAMC